MESGTSVEIAVVGAGGVGGYVGGRLATAGADVHLVDRGDHLDGLRRRGLSVESVHGDFHVDAPATDTPADVGPVDYVLLCVKSFDTGAAVDTLEPLVREGTAVVSLQNGLLNEETLVEELGREHVMGGVAYIFSTIAEPGVIEHTGGPARIVFGELDGSRSERAERLLGWCERADIDAELSEDIHSVLWEKAAFICAQAGMTAAVRLPLGEIRSTPESWDMYRRIAEEVCSVARGVDVPDSTVDRWVEFARDLNADTYSSLHYDLTHDNRMELDALHGAVVRRGRSRHVATPMPEAIYAKLGPWARRNAELAGRRE